uniref:F-box domain-containing protein n=1 Tax=Poecilia latipinna TaxID=48699 RepID=A0A3B3U437_9TELE
SEHNPLSHSLLQSRVVLQIWTHVFSYLSVSDKLSIRACCKYFRKLIDHWSLWRGWTVVLTFKSGSYTKRFWNSLRRRKVTSMVVRSPRAKDWRQLCSELPHLSSLVLEQSVMENLGFGKDFPHLERLAIRNSDVVIDAHKRTHLEQLTQLSLCDVTFPIKSSFLPFISHLRNLTSLTCHNSGTSVEPIWIMETILSYLPNLKDLSLSSKRACVYVPKRPLNERISSLSTLELIQYSDHFFPVNTMKKVPHLNSLSVFSGNDHQRMMPSASSHLVFLLNKWLQDLPKLTKLAVTRGPPVKTYVTSIPATVTSLALCSSVLSSEDMTSISAQLPNLLHLHVDPRPSHQRVNIAQIPVLFPKLRSLKLRHESVPEKDFLHLHRLQHLEHLEILDGAQSPLHLSDELRALTKNRLHVGSSPRHSDPMLCECIHQVY